MLTGFEDIFTHNRPFIGAVVFWFGAIIGSFLNVVIYRLPKMMERDWRNQCAQLLYAKVDAKNKKDGLNLLLPPSHCPHCQHNIRWFENVPIASYLFLHGKCSCCKQPISIRYPLIEILSAVLSTIIILHFGLNAAGFSALLLTWALIALAAIDFDTQLLPDDITLPLLWFGLVINILTVHSTLNDAVIGAIVGYLSLWSIYWAFKLLTGKEGMGYGDFKLLAVFGAWLGWQAVPIIIIISSVMGSVIGIGLILIKGRDSQLPISFGPYLAIAGWITLMWREPIAAQFPTLFL